MRVLVIGGSGLVGKNVIQLCGERGFEVRGTYLTSSSKHLDQKLDKTDAEKTTELVSGYDPDIVIDTAAFHAVDDCETQRERAWAVNATGTRNAAVAANGVGAHFVYLSTDYVFGGDPREAPYTEGDPVSPLNYYAQCKYAGEQAAKIADVSTVLRSSVIFGLLNDNFVTWVLSELRSGNELKIVDDQTSTPTYAPDLADACLTVGTEGLTGLYHATGPACLSRFEFTRKLAEIVGYDPGQISPTSTEKLGQTADRPTDGSLDSTALYDAIGWEFQEPTQAFQKLREEWQSKE